ncbi:BZ3500_MvSof-1268-A1-R1_Chr4-4g07464 [Microbotryum saponariae]|uniref:Ubiquitin thioesterase OTU n=1 Tax=Microbotryum saponariae TaxID=289078 RepID=A0A2X0KW11_9BASI|nr:BZ3500_MvSof-1268-A1-R1_Chr4-4g07464 [Microbotryum saponariae]SDA07125.1 BZ3501_MvSof-1269-A2-R1_Chr4-3g07172 [Microbotryum saponariae]
MTTIALRIRGPNGAHSVSVPAEASLEHLMQKVTETTSIPLHQQECKSSYPPTLLGWAGPLAGLWSDSALERIANLKGVRTGFPPKPIPTSSPSTTTLSQLGLRSGESVQVTANTSAAETASTGSAASTSVGNTSTHLDAIASSSTSPLATNHRVSATSASTSTSSAGAGRYVQFDGGYLCLRTVPDDNSCLFRAVGLLLAPDRGDLRQLVADVIRNNPETWSEAVLGQPQESYINTILKPNSWGGAIELAIFASYFNTAIASIDVKTGRVDEFGEGEGYENVAVLVYSGIREIVFRGGPDYDAVTFSYAEPSSADVYPFPNLDFDTRLFSRTSGYDQASVMLIAAQELVTTLRKTHQFTDAATFTLKCEQCGKAIVGEKEARAHASETGHVKFGEYDG